jgi:hypothetical protein
VGVHVVEDARMGHTAMRGPDVLLGLRGMQRIEKLAKWLDSRRCVPWHMVPFLAASVPSRCGRQALCPKNKLY